MKKQKPNDSADSVTSGHGPETTDVRVCPKPGLYSEDGKVMSHDDGYIILLPVTSKPDLIRMLLELDTPFPAPGFIPHKLM